MRTAVRVATVLSNQLPNRAIPKPVVSSRFNPNAYALFMTPIWTLVLLGIVQGLTEFLPVSSSGHLVIIQSILPSFNEPGVLFYAVVHLGTLGAVLIYFRRDLLDMTRCLISPRTADPVQLRLMLLILVGTLPTVVIALTFKEELELLFSNVSTAAGMLLITGTLLYLTDRARERTTDVQKMNVGHALIVGIAQGFAIIPGISRSGSTIAAGVFSGLKREVSLRYSFLLSIPAIFGAFGLQLATHQSPGGQEVDWIGYGLAFIAAFGVGYASIEILLKMLLAQKLTFFAYYCWALGVSVLGVRLFGGEG